MRNKIPDAARRIATVMELLPEHKREILLAYGEGMAVMALRQMRDDGTQFQQSLACQGTNVTPPV